jgi:hypothetical protein
MGGSAALAAGQALPRSLERLAFAMSTDPGFADKNPWVMEAVNAVARELQCWYRRHSIRRYLAQQIRRRLAATTLQCWKRRIWLDCWFAQQDIQRQKCLCLQSLCRGASAYAMLVWGDRRPPPTPTDKPSDPKVLRHPFRDRGQPLPRRRQAQQTIILVVAQVNGIGLVLQILRILEGGRSACLFIFWQHKLWWQHWNFIVLGLLAQVLQPTFLHTRLPPLSNLHTNFTSIVSSVKYFLIL